MDKDLKLKIIEDMQAVAEQMRLDDIMENPDSEFEMFACDCCGEEKPKAGSMLYGHYILCNDCVLLAETSIALNKIGDIKELIDGLEDKRLADMCRFILEEQGNINN
jgi:hypothetical protein